MVQKLENTYYYVIMVLVALLLVAFHTIFFNGPGYSLPDGDLPEIVPTEHVKDVTGSHWYGFSGAEKGFFGEELAFMTVHQLVDVYADETHLYSIRPRSTVFGTTTGTVWNFVAIPEGTAEVRVKLTGIYEVTADQDMQFFYGDGDEMQKLLLQKSLPSALLSVFHSICGIFLVLVWLLINSRLHVNRALVFLGMFSFCLGLWSFGESDLATILFPDRAGAAFAAFVLLMFMLMPFTSFIREILGSEEQAGWSVLFGYNLFVMVVSFTLQAFHIKDMRELLFLTHLGFVMITVYALYSVILVIRRRGVGKALWANIVGLVILLIATATDLLHYYNDWKDASRFGQYGFTIYILMMAAYTATTALRQLEDAKKAVYYKELANTDVLTGLLNRNAYILDVKHGGYGGGAAIITFDLNELKRINDVLGHLTGDQYIRDSAALIVEIFGAHGKCYRIGGDEFCTILKHTSINQIQALIHDLKERQTDCYQNLKFVSAGIACGYAMFDPENDADLEAARSRADQYMYRDKKREKEDASAKE